MGMGWMGGSGGVKGWVRGKEFVKRNGTNV